MDEPDIRSLFEPDSIAVIGASQNPNKIGHKILSNILSGGYQGKVYPVNPGGEEILGLRTYPRLEGIEDPIDVACIVVPAPRVFEAVKACAQKRVKFVIIISSGFSEIGNREEENRIVRLAHDYGIRVLGPNIFGIFSAPSALNATFGPSHIRSGNIAIITQSGALGIAMIGRTTVENMGLSAIISVGNKSDINETDLLQYLTHHEGTKVIMIYIEGLKEGHRFIQALRETTKKKPVVVVKAGRSQRGAMAAASHTGALAGSDEIFDYLMRQAHVLRAESLQDALEWCKFLARTPLPKQEDTVIVTNGGGIGVLATDACEKYGVKLYDDHEALKETFGDFMPYFGSTRNPIDLTGQATSELYSAAFQAALSSPKIHGLISLYCETALFDIDRFSPIIEETTQQFQAAQKPVVFCLVGGTKTEECVNRLKTHDVPVFKDPYGAVSSLGALYTYCRYLQSHVEKVDEAPIDTSRIHEVIKKVRDEGRRSLLAHEGREVMEAAGIPMPKSFIALTLDQAVKGCESMGYPVVMKVISRDILHKSDVGGVALDLVNKKEVIEAFEAIMYNCRTRRPDARIEGVEISEMALPGAELIVGARVDQSFGPVAMVGLGGIYVEVMKDVSFRSLPLNREEVRNMIKEIKSYPILLGVRGETKKDIDSLVETIIQVGTILTRCQEISDIEINPLIVYDRGVKALDVRILLSPT